MQYDLSSNLYTIVASVLLLLSDSPLRHHSGWASSSTWAHSLALLSLLLSWIFHALWLVHLLLLHLLRSWSGLISCLVRFGFETLGAQGLLDVLLEFLIFLAAHVVDFFFLELCHAGHELLSNCRTLFLLPRKRPLILNLLLPQRLHGLISSLPSSIWFINSAKPI